MGGYIPQFGDEIDRDHPLMDGLVGWWPMLEGGGSTLYDLSERGNHGTLTNMDAATDWSVGPIGAGALDFDGSNDHVRVGNIVETAGGSGYSFATWVLRKASGAYALFGQSDNQVRRHVVYLTTSGRIGCFFGDGSGAQGVYKDGSVFPTNVWAHVCVSLEFDGVCRRYLNGAQTGSAAFFGDIELIDTDGNDDALGARKRSSATEDLYLNGKLSDCRYWNRALTAEEVKQVYHDPWSPFIRRKVYSIPQVGGGSSALPILNHYMMS